MPLILQVKDPKLCVWKMDEPLEEMASLLNDVSIYEDELQCIKSAARRKERLATYVLLNKLLGHDVILRHGESGFPYLLDEPYSISISHTDDFVAVVISSDNEKRVAVDIEYHSNRVFRVRNRFMSPQELAFLDPVNNISHLLVCWCAKETLYKIIDLPAMDYIRHLHIRPFPYAKEGEIEAYETRTGFGQSFQLKYQVNDQYVLVWFG